jgi:hypothetical protein
MIHVNAVGRAQTWSVNHISQHSPIDNVRSCSLLSAFVHSDSSNNLGRGALCGGCVRNNVERSGRDYAYGVNETVWSDRSDWRHRWAQRVSTSSDLIMSRDKKNQRRGITVAYAENVGKKRSLFWLFGTVSVYPVFLRTCKFTTAQQLRVARSQEPFRVAHWPVAVRPGPIDR